MLAVPVARSTTARRAALLATTTMVGGGGAYLATSQNESIRGIRRQAYFWSRVGPVVGSYFWNYSSSSPLVKYLEWRGQMEDDTKKERLKELHVRHSDAIFRVMIDLKGLYIKLGQVLSVTALPVPEVYRTKFRLLQSSVEGWEDFDDVIRPLLEEELGKPLEELFDHVDPVPCGAASIGQAHKATTLEGEDVILKVQYRDASWQVPADIASVGTLLRICVLAGVVDETAARLSFDDFSRQFSAELDYEAEKRNLETIYASSMDPAAPYIQRNVVVPKVLEEYCSPHVIGMEFLKGPKLEEEAHRQMQQLGIDTKRNLRELAKRENGPTSGDETRPSTPAPAFLKNLEWVTKWVGIDRLLWAFRLLQRLALYGTGMAAQTVSAIPFTPSNWNAWAEGHANAAEQAQKLSMTADWVDALLDVHGHQIFNLGLFNGDPHPGNILVNDKQLGLIDFGQCKKLTLAERKRIAHLMLAVAGHKSNDEIADAFRKVGVATRNDNTDFLARFAKLMFGPFQSEHLSRSWHKEMHDMDHIDYFPPELSMVYRTTLLLRGLAISLQTNPSISDHWKKHAEKVLTIPDEHQEEGMNLSLERAGKVVLEIAPNKEYIPQSQ